MIPVTCKNLEDTLEATYRLDGHEFTFVGGRSTPLEDDVALKFLASNNGAAFARTDGIEEEIVQAPAPIVPDAKEPPERAPLKAHSRRK